MNEKNNVLVIFYVIIVPRQQKNILRHNDRFIENGKSLSSNIFRKVVLNHKYQKNIHVAFINSVWFLADCRKIIKDVLSLDLIAKCTCFIFSQISQIGNIVIKLAKRSDFGRIKTRIAYGEQNVRFSAELKTAYGGQ